MGFISKFIKIPLIAILIAFALIIALKPKPTGMFVWNNFKFADAALFLNHDSNLALKIGNYYFNVYGDGAYDLEKAEKYFKLALEIDPKTPDAWHQLARIDFLKGNFPSALKKINKQIEIHGDSLMAAYYIRGLISGYNGDLEQAEKDFKKFLIWDNKNWAAYNDLAWIYFQKGKYKKTEDTAKIGLKSDSSNPWLLNALGMSLFNLGEKEEAKKALILAKNGADKLTEKDWHKAYPGNNPKSSAAGLEKIKKTIEYNLNLIGL